MNKLSRFLVVVCVVLLATLVFSGFFIKKDTSINKKTLEIAGNVIDIEIADTPTSREKGLSGQKSLKDNSGLLFVFEKSDFYGIWMKEMLFAIDIIWISPDHKITDIKENATPESFPEIFTPKSKSLYVLETPVGFVKSHNLSVGDSVIF